MTVRLISDACCNFCNAGTIPESTTPPLTLVVPSTIRGRAFSSPQRPRTFPQLPRRSRSRSPTNTSPRGAAPPRQHLPSFSLLSALEFRDVVASLRHQTGSPSLAVFESPSTSLSTRHRSLAPPPGLTIQASRADAWDATLGRRIHLAPLGSDSSTTTQHSTPTTGTVPPLPAISVDSPSSRTSSDEGLNYPPTLWQRIISVLKHTYHVLFPHLHSFSSKSFINIVVAIFATPGVLVLTVTLPVVMTPYGDSQQSRLPKPDEAAEGRLIDFEEDGVERVLVAEDELKDELYTAHFNKWLTACQCMLAPLFCVVMVVGKFNLPGSELT